MKLDKQRAKAAVESIEHGRFIAKRLIGEKVQSIAQGEDPGGDVLGKLGKSVLTREFAVTKANPTLDRRSKSKYRQKCEVPHGFRGDGKLGWRPPLCWPRNQRKRVRKSTDPTVSVEPRLNATWTIQFELDLLDAFHPPRDSTRHPSGDFGCLGNVF